MAAKVKIFPDPERLAEAVAGRWRQGASQAQASGRSFNVALSGGRTPRRIYQVLAGMRDAVPWDAVHLFWSDERCVPPDHDESNYRMVREALIDPVSLPEKNVHRMVGENDPVIESARYTDEILNHLHPGPGELPRFDWILLGVGTDGHTASLFADAQTLSANSGVCAPADHPDSGQKRITLTLQVLNRADRVSFIVTGKEKAKVVAQILNGTPESKRFPAAQVNAGSVEWFLDREAASLLQS